MNSGALKTLYKMNLKRINAAILGVLFSAMLSLIIIITLFKFSISGAEMGGNPVSTNALAYMYFLTIFFGITFSILVFQEIKSDFTSGVFYTFMTYPVKPGQIILSKVLAIWVYVVIYIVVTFSLFILISGSWLVYGIWLTIGIFLGTFTLLIISLFITFILSPLSDFSPLPEMIIIGFFLGITLFSYALPSQYIAIIAPFFTIVKSAAGMKISFKEDLFAIASPILYLVFAYMSYIFMNLRKRREIK